MSSYRYEGARIEEEAAKFEAKTLCRAIRNVQNKREKAMEEEEEKGKEEIVRIVATRSKPHLQAIYTHYQEICGQNMDEV